MIDPRTGKDPLDQFHFDVFQDHPDRVMEKIIHCLEEGNSGKALSLACEYMSNVHAQQHVDQALSDFKKFLNGQRG